MGVSGCGKTTIGKLLSEELNLPFYDADDFHPESNILKMSNGLPLNDNDREPWLKLLADKIFEWNHNDGAILACSALKESYRKILSSQVEKIDWVYLKGSFNIIKSRMLERNKHFMKAEMLQSQFDTLEEPNYGTCVKINSNPDEIINEIIKKLECNG